MTRVRISGSIRLEGDGIAVEEGFRDDKGLPADGTEAVFPIFRMSMIEDWAPIGTGFFISNNGLFATAKHARKTGTDLFSANELKVNGG